MQAYDFDNSDNDDLDDILETERHPVPTETGTGHDPLDEDGDTPTAPPDDVPEPELDDTHPLTDAQSDLDYTEIYNQGLTMPT